MAEIEFKLTDEQKKKKAELEAKHGVECYLIRGAGVDAWYKEPTIGDVELFMTDNGDPKSRGRALIDLLRRNLADGTTETVFGKRAGAIVSHAGKYADVVGISTDAILGK
jgi:hypothetical protein